MKKFEVKSLYDEVTATITYVVYDKDTRDAIVIDPVLDYDPASSKVSTESLDKLENLLKSERLNVHYCLETHAHADHLSGAQELKNRFPQIKLAIGERITEVQSVFKKIFNLARLKRHSIGLNLPGWHWADFIHLSLGLPPFAD